MNNDETTFGRFVLTRRLAFGGMAEIFLASLRGDEGFSKTVVLKRILPHFGEDSGFVQMFIEEARLAARLSHPNIVQIYDFGNVAGTYFIAMEYVEGADLRTALRHPSDVPAQLPVPLVALIGEHVARGLAFAHAAKDDHGHNLGIVHRDVSPHNIMLSHAGVAKITDFGIAKAADRVSRTHPGALKGKVAYMAPEQALGRPVDARTDQFALGLVLWEAIAGRRVYDGDSDLAILGQASVGATVALSSVQPEVHATIEGIIMKALAKDPEQRHSSLTAMADELAAFRLALGEQGVVDLGRFVADIAHQSVPMKPRESAFAETILELGTRDLVVEKQSAWTDLPVDGTPTPQTITRYHEQEQVQAQDEVEMAPHTLILHDAVQRRGEQVQSGLDEDQGNALATRHGLWLWCRTYASWLWAGGAVMMFGLGIAHSYVLRPVQAIVVARPLYSALTLVSAPDGAEVWLDGFNTGLVTPTRLPRLATDREVILQLRQNGCVTWEKKIVLHQALEEIRIEVPSSTCLHDDTASSGVSYGYLSLRMAGGWAHVYIGNHFLGTTPLQRVRVTSGKQTLRLVNPETNDSRLVKVDVRPNRENRRTIYAHEGITR